uniref:Uncharacterized protein n=1 Tax=Anguilla anguilla TaxID=7936 RepID=A0A0E9R8Z2_ANGAN
MTEQLRHKESINISHTASNWSREDKAIKPGWIQAVTAICIITICHSFQPGMAVSCAIVSSMTFTYRAFVSWFPAHAIHPFQHTL